MNRTSRLIAAFLILHLSFLASANAQSDDFGIDLSASAEKKLARGIDFTLEVGARTQDNSSSMERLTAGGTLGVKVLNTKKFDVKLSAGWEYLHQRRLGERENKYGSERHFTSAGLVSRTILTGYNDTEPLWRPRHRTTLAAKASYQPNKRWSFALKESVLYSHYGEATRTTHRYRTDLDAPQPVITYQDDKLKTLASKDRFVLRSAATAKYNIRHCPLNPFATIDYGCGLNYSVQKWRYTIGTSYNINKTNSLEIYYRYQTENDDDEPNGHIAALSYSIKL